MLNLSDECSSISVQLSSMQLMLSSFGPLRGLRHLLVLSFYDFFCLISPGRLAGDSLININIMTKKKNLELYHANLTLKI